MRVEREPWDGDHAHTACKAWLAGWRKTHGDEAPAPWTAALEVGNSARRLVAAGVGRSDLTSLMWAAGRDGVPSPDLEDGGNGSRRAA